MGAVSDRAFNSRLGRSQTPPHSAAYPSATDWRGPALVKPQGREKPRNGAPNKRRRRRGSECGRDRGARVQTCSKGTRPQGRSPGGLPRPEGRARRRRRHSPGSRTWPCGPPGSGSRAVGLSAGQEGGRWWREWTGARMPRTRTHGTPHGLRQPPHGAGLAHREVAAALWAPEIRKQAVA